MAITWFVRTPVAYSGSATGLHYNIVKDFPDVDTTTGRIFGRTQLEVPTDSALAVSRLVPPFPAMIWFRMTGGTTEYPAGELVLEMHPQRGKPLADSLHTKGLLIPSFFSCGTVTLEGAAWKTAFQTWLGVLKAKHHIIDAAGAKQPLSPYSASEIFDQFFLTGQVVIQVEGAATDEILPLATSSSSTITLTMLLGHLNPEPSSKDPPSVRQLLEWARKPENAAKGLDEFESASGANLVTPIPLGHFYALVDKEQFASAQYANHFFLRRLLQANDGFWDSAYNPLWLFIDPNVPRWRRVVLGCDVSKRGEPLFWHGWANNDVVVNGTKQRATAAGVSYWLLKDGTHTVELQSRSGGSAIQVRGFLQHEFGNEASASVTEPDVAVLANVTTGVLVTNVSTGAEYATHDKPADLAGNSQTARFKVQVTLDGAPVFDICTGKANDETMFSQEWNRWGVNILGVETLERGIDAHWDVLSADGWTVPQRRVIAAMTPNEGKLDALNTYDNAFISMGILQWALYADTEKQGELAAFLKFLEASDAERFHEYYGRHGIQTRDVAQYPADDVPRGFVELNNTVTLNEASGAAKDEMRKYIWSARFRIAAMDPVVQLAQLKMAYDRLRIIRDRRIRLSNNVEYTLGELFTSEQAAAYLLDQHTNRPAAVDADIKRAIGNALPNNGFGQLDHDLIMQAYAFDPGHKRHMYNPMGRRQQIDAAGLTSTVGVFEWPSGPACAWLPAP